MVKKKLVKGLWSKSEVALLRKLFSNNPTAKVAVRLGRSLDTVKKKASRMGLKKTKKYLKSLDPRNISLQSGLNREAKDSKARLANLGVEVVGKERYEPSFTISSKGENKWH